MRSYKPTTTSRQKDSREKYILVREDLFYGLVIENGKTNKISIDRGITSTPTFIFHTANTKCLIDFCAPTNPAVQIAADEYFNQFVYGTTFYVYNAYYLDTNTNNSADLSGQYIFRSYYQGIVEADVTSVTSLNSNVTRYDRTKFEEIPYIVPNTINTEELQVSVIKNKFGKNTKNSFYYLGAKVGDYIRLTDITSHLQILEINVDSDGTEYITVDRVLDESDMTNKKTKVELYVVLKEINQNKNLLTVSTDASTTGVCLEVQNNVVISCTDYHTSDQCRFREDRARSVVTTFNAGQYCKTPETMTASQTNQNVLAQLTLSLAQTMNNMNKQSIVQGINGNKNFFYGRNF